MAFSNNLFNKYANSILSDFIRDLNVHVNNSLKLDRINDKKTRQAEKVKLCIDIYSYLNENIEYVIRSSNLILIDTASSFNEDKTRKLIKLLYTMYIKIFQFRDEINELLKSRTITRKTRNNIYKLFRILKKSENIFNSIHLQIPFETIKNNTKYELEPIYFAKDTYSLIIRNNRIPNDIITCDTNNNDNNDNNNNNNNDNKKVCEACINDIPIESIVNNKPIISDNKNEKKIELTPYMQNRPRRNVPIVNYAGMQ